MRPRLTAFERNFAGARATFHRNRDARILHGWTERAEGYGIVVRAAAQPKLEIGEKFSFHLSGRDGDAVFCASLVDTAPGTPEDAWALVGGSGSFMELSELCYSFKIDGKISLVKSQVEARFSQDRGTCVINGSLETGVKDVSEHGLGILAEEPLAPKTIVSATIYAGTSVIEAKAEVRYCRKITDNPIAYRIGLQFSELDRINGSRWNTVLQATP